ncbi:MAG: L-cystine-binding protein TcyK, partial [Lachnospiraceae bacterium]|nr:L-cystine-binding protein TcyK [Lachnospiraceae bacterium]
MKKFGKIAAVTLGTSVVLSSILTGCGSKADVVKAAGSDDSGEVKKIIIGSGVNYNPYCYLDE